MVAKNQLKCEECEHVWIPRILSPKNCAKCNSPNWSIKTLSRNKMERGGKVTHSNKGLRGQLSK